jgi:hypothetical protein
MGDRVSILGRHIAHQILLKNPCKPDNDVRKAAVFTAAYSPVKGPWSRRLLGSPP